MLMTTKNQGPLRFITGGLRVGGLAVALCGLWLGTGCVSHAVYEEARSAAQVEREAHRRAQARLQQVEQSLAALRADLTRRESAIQDQERQLAETDLNLKLAHQERDQHGELVDQLRGELARVGDHLKVYSEEKNRLAAELQRAEGRSQAVNLLTERVTRLTRVVRDFSLLEGPAIGSGVVTLASDGENPVLHVPRKTLAPDGSLGADGLRLVKSLGRLAELHDAASFVISERPGADQGLPDAVLLGQVSQALIEAGVPSNRVTLDVAEAASETAGEAVAASAPSSTAPSDAEIMFVIRLDSAPQAASAELTQQD
jgi:hypothetical protein